MKKVLLIAVIVLGYMVINNISVDDVINHIKSENKRIQKVEFCNDIYKGRPDLLNKCLLDE